MGKSLKGKELGQGISQRQDGTYQARFVNRFGKRQTIYAKKYKEVLQKLRDAQAEDEKKLNVVSKDVTLDEWFDIWLDTCKKNCRETTKECYGTSYNRVKNELGWRKLTSLNLVIMQRALNGLCSDNARKTTKGLLCDIMDKAVDSDLLVKNVAKQLNTVITKEEKKERRVLTKKETECFLEEAQKSNYYNMYAVALETGMRLGELCALQWQDIDFEKNMIYVNHTLCYYNKNGKFGYEFHDTKTKSGKRKIPLTKTAIKFLKLQKLQKQRLIASGKIAEKPFQNLIFTNKDNRPINRHVVDNNIKLICKSIQKVHEEFEEFASHTFRHTFATRAVENGVQPKTLSKILGHSKIEITMNLYCHVTDDSLVEAMEKMETAV
mgnify:FL=1|jgi:integrase